MTLSVELHGRCSLCNASGLRSTVREASGTTRTLMFAQTYYDEEGHRHVHDPNRATSAYICSQGHRWTESEALSCPVEGCEEYGKRGSVRYLVARVCGDCEGKGAVRSVANPGFSDLCETCGGRGGWPPDDAVEEEVS